LRAWWGGNWVALAATDVGALKVVALVEDEECKQNK